MTLTFKRLHECTLDEAVKVWNEGFSGYFFNATMTVDAFVARIALEQLSPTLSFIVYDGDQAVGIVMNGVREVKGQTIAWNGGTGVIPERRGTGVGKAIIDYALQIYRERQVDIATLEAITENEKAIRLYKGSGYEVVDHLYYWGCDTELPDLDDREPRLQFRGVNPHDVRKYEAVIPWQSHWSHFRRDGEALLAYDGDEAIGYALFRRAYDAEGNNIGIVIAQCAAYAQPKREAGIIRALLSRIVRPEQKGYKRTLSVLGSSECLQRLLPELGFKQTASQVVMTRRM